MVGVAVVGQGYMGRTHAEAWTELGQRVEYVVGRGERAPSSPTPWAAFTTDLDDALRDPSVGIVSVCTPTATHVEFAVRALRAGKHVVVEKPIALALADVESVVTAAVDGPLIMVAHVVRFFAGYRAVRDLVSDGTAGAISEVNASRSMSTPGWSDWLSDESQSGGMLVDFAIHDFDQANLFLGHPENVRAVQRPAGGPVETTIEYRDGGLGRVLSHSAMPVGSPFRSSIEVLAERAQADYLFIDAEPTPTQALAPLSRLTVHTTDGTRVRDIPPSNAYAAELRYFLDCIESGSRPVDGSLESAADALAVSLAARESLARGAAVQLLPRRGI